MFNVQINCPLLAPPPAYQHAPPAYHDTPSAPPSAPHPDSSPHTHAPPPKFRNNHKHINHNRIKLNTN